MWKIFQRLMVIKLTEDRLVLRELPLTSWFFTAIFFVVGFLVLAFNMTETAPVAFLVGFFFAVTSQMQYIIFDKPARNVTVVRAGLVGREVTQTIPLNEVTMAYLYVADDSASQAVLIVRGDMFGLSHLSKLGYSWKERIVIVINAFLKVDMTSLSVDAL